MPITAGICCNTLHNTCQSMLAFAVTRYTTLANHRWYFFAHSAVTTYTALYNHRCCTLVRTVRYALTSVSMPHNKWLLIIDNLSDVIYKCSPRSAWPRNSSGLLLPSTRPCQYPAQLRTIASIKLIPASGAETWYLIGCQFSCRLFAPPNQIILRGGYQERV